LPCWGQDRDFDFAFLDIENRVGRIALLEDNLLLRMLRPVAIVSKNAAGSKRPFFFAAGNRTSIMAPCKR
jgi:hypothetical protein